MSLAMALLIVIFVCLIATVVVVFAYTVNWRLLTVWNGGPTFMFHRMGSLFRHIESIEGPLGEDKVRPIIGYVCHVTFFPCDIKYLGNFAICYTSTDSREYVKMGYHWAGECPCKDSNKDSN